MDDTALGAMPAERSRYRALGAVLLTTSAISGLLVGFAAYYAIGVAPWAAVTATVCFSAVLVSLDRWLIVSPFRPAAARRTGFLLIRVLVAVVFGTVLSQPVLLATFAPAIDEQISLARPPGITARVDPRALLPAESDVDAEILATDRRLAELRRRLGVVCAGNEPPVTGGGPSTGAGCRLMKEQADAVAAELELLQRRSTFSAEQRMVRVDARGRPLAYERSSRFEILRQRSAALSLLMDDNTTLYLAAWSLRVFLIAFLLLPLLTRFVGSGSTYRTEVIARDRQATTAFLHDHPEVDREISSMLARQRREFHALVPVRSAGSHDR